MKKSFWFPTLHTILCKFVTIIMFAFLSFLFLSLSSDVNDDCCSGCQYANSSTVCMEYAPGNIQCLENITCTGSDKKCPVSQFSYVPVESPCRVDGKCYPPDSECSRYTHTVIYVLCKLHFLVYMYLNMLILLESSYMWLCCIPLIILYDNVYMY